MRLHGKDYSAASLARMAGDLAAAGGVRSVMLGDGAERGVRALEFRTGAGWLAAGESRSYSTTFRILDAGALGRPSGRAEALASHFARTPPALSMIAKGLLRF
jgi:hypothetical protein